MTYLDLMLSSWEDALCISVWLLQSLALGAVVALKLLRRLEQGPIYWRGIKIMELVE